MFDLIWLLLVQIQRVKADAFARRENERVLQYQEIRRKRMAVAESKQVQEQTTLKVPFFGDVRTCPADDDCVCLFKP